MENGIKEDWRKREIKRLLIVGAKSIKMPFRVKVIIYDFYHWNSILLTQNALRM